MTTRLKLDGTKLLHHLDVLNKWNKGQFPYPIHLDIGATSRCNFKCVHCFYDYLAHKKYFIKRERLLGLMREIGAAGVKSIYFASDGEPFLNTAVPDAIVEAKDHGVDVAMSTNGVLLTKAVAEKILGRLSFIRVSILAHTEKVYRKLHGARLQDRARLVANLKDAVAIRARNRYTVTIGAQMCLLPQNVAEPAPLARELKDIGLDYLVIRPISQNPRNAFKVEAGLVERAREHLQEAEGCASDDFKVSVRWDAEEETKGYSKCYGLPFIAFVGADGGVYACGSHLEEPDYCYGNIYQSSFADIWKSPRYRKVLKRITEIPEPGKCDILCRHHSLNKFLWDVKNPPEHVNFI